MNTEINIIAAIILIIIFLPIYLLNKTGNTYLKKLSKKIDAIALNNNLKLNQKEGWGNTCIGIDTAQQKLVYKRGLESDDYSFIDLREIYSCEFLKEVTPKRVDKTLINQLATLDLKLTLKKNKAQILLNFYDIDNGYVEDFELKRIEKWIKIINENLTTTDYKKVA